MISFDSHVTFLWYYIWLFSSASRVKKKRTLHYTSRTMADLQYPITGIQSEDFISKIYDYRKYAAKRWKFAARSKSIIHHDVIHNPFNLFAISSSWFFAKFSWILFFILFCTYLSFSCQGGVAGTPWYFVNNIDLGLDMTEALTLNDWISILDPLVEKNQEQARHTMTHVVRPMSTRMETSGSNSLRNSIYGVKLAFVITLLEVHNAWLLWSECFMSIKLRV